MSENCLNNYFSSERESKNYLFSSDGEYKICIVKLEIRY